MSSEKEQQIAITIQSGVKIPPRQGAPKGPLALAMLKMKAGDSLLVKKRIDSAKSLAQTYLGAGKYATRSVEGGLRIWKLK